MSLCLALLCASGSVQAQSAASPSAVHPEYRWLSRDVPLLAASGTLLVAAHYLAVTRPLVPPTGLEPNGVRWFIDRNAIGNANVRADRDSDYFLMAALAYPALAAPLSQPAGARLSGSLRRSLEYVEAIALAEGLANVLKKSFDRPRPYAYLSSAERPTNASYDVRAEDAFRSMPSGHAVGAFAGASFAMTDHLLTRPHASWQERVAVASLGGFLAGMTATLRVKAGQHFPSDAVVGGLIGTASGMLVPLVHDYVDLNGQRAPGPSAHAWWQAIAADLGGIGLGVLAAQLY